MQGLVRVPFSFHHPLGEGDCHSHSMFYLFSKEVIGKQQHLKRMVLISCGRQIRESTMYLFDEFSYTNLLTMWRGSWVVTFVYAFYPFINEQEVQLQKDKNSVVIKNKIVVL